MDLEGRLGPDAGERFQRVRRRVLLVLTIVFIALQFVFPSGSGDNPGLPLWGTYKLPAFLIFAAALLIMMMAPGGMLFLRRHRAAFNDELTRKHRAGGFTAGLLASLTTATGMYFRSMSESVTTRDALHAVISLGVVTTVLVFVFLEERAERAS
jgi:membrane protease YdiL (CAAX protease family)